MTDADALLAAVVAAPADDLPRLVFADWLDEHGQPDRAAFVRLHVRLAGLADDHPDRAAVHGRAADLFRAGWGEWVAPVLAAFGQRPHPTPPTRPPSRWDRLLGRTLPPAAPDDGLDTSGPEFTTHLGEGELRGTDFFPYLPAPVNLIGLARGFPDRLELNHRRVPGPAAVEAALAAAPITSVGLLLLSTESALSWEAFEAPALGRVRRLTVRGRLEGLSSAAVARVLGTGAWANVAALGLGYDAAGADLPEEASAGACLRAFLASPLVPTVRRLTVPLGPDAFAALARYPADGPLEELARWHPTVSPRFRPEAWEQLALTRLQTQLVRLRLDDADLGDDGLLAFTWPRRWDRLERLSLARTGVGDRGVAGLCRYGLFPVLQNLDLSANAVGDLGAAVLSRSGLPSTLRGLDLSNNRVGRAGADALIAGFRAGPLERLTLTYNPLGRSAATRLRAAFGDRVRL